MGIRVDGLDTLTQPIPAGALGATNGKIAFYYTPRHSSGDYEKFGHNNPRMFTVKGTSNYIDVYFNTNFNATLRTFIGAENTNDSQAVALTAGTKHLIEIEYNATQCILYVDGVVKITITPASGINFGADIPSTFYGGSDFSGTTQGDAIFS